LAANAADIEKIPPLLIFIISTPQTKSFLLACMADELGETFEKKSPSALFCVEIATTNWSSQMRFLRNLKPAFLPVFVSLLPFMLVACTALERKELAEDFHNVAVPALTNPVNYTSPTAAIGAVIGIAATIATNYIRRKFFSGDKK
jgi:hypothetical protein